MAHFNYTQPGGIWTYGTVIQQAHMNDFEQKMFKAINGDDGGVWAPSAKIEIAGSGLELSGSTGLILPSVASGSITDYAPGFDTYPDSNWSKNRMGYQEDTSVASPHYVLFLFKLPVGVTITDVSLGVRGSTSGTMVSVSPDHRAYMELFQFESTDYALTDAILLGTAVDSSADNATYTADHKITLSGLSHSVVESSHYGINLVVQTDGNATTGFRAYRPSVTGTIDQITIQ